MHWMSAECPVRVILRTTGLGTFSLDLHRSCSSHKVVCALNSLSREGSPVLWLISLTEVGIMYTGDLADYGPQEALQLSLVHSLDPSLSLGLKVRKIISHRCSCKPDLVNELQHGLCHQRPVPGVQPGAPHPCQDLFAMGNVVSHHVEAQPRLQPVLHRCLLPGGQSAVQVPGRHHGHLGVHQGDKSPQLPVDWGQVSQVGEGVNRTHVQPAWCSAQWGRRGRRGGGLTLGWSTGGHTASPHRPLPASSWSHRASWPSRGSESPSDLNTTIITLLAMTCSPPRLPTIPSQ